MVNDSESIDLSAATDIGDKNISICSYINNSLLRYLVDRVRVDRVVEAGVQVIEKVDHLKRRRARGYRREADNVREVDGDLAELLGVDGHAELQLLGDRAESIEPTSRHSARTFPILISDSRSDSPKQRGIRTARRRRNREIDGMSYCLPGQHPVEQLLGLLLLHVELLRALANQFLQIVRVLLEHLEHRVHKVHFSGNEGANKTSISNSRPSRDCPRTRARTVRYRTFLNTRRKMIKEALFNYFYVFDIFDIFVSKHNKR